MIPINEQPYPLPEGWQWCRLGDVTKNQYGYTAKALKNNKLPKMLRITDIQNGVVNCMKFPTAKSMTSKRKNTCSKIMTLLLLEQGQRREKVTS